MNILVFGYFFMVVNHASTNVIYTINKQRKLIPFYAVSVCFSIALNYLFIKAGFGIRGVALATAISYLIFYLVNFSYALKHIISWGKLLRLHAEIAGYFIYFLAGIVTINRFVILNNMLLETIIRVVCLVVLTLPVFIEIQVRERFFSLLFASISPYFTRKKV